VSALCGERTAVKARWNQAWILVDRPIAARNDAYSRLFAGPVSGSRAAANHIATIRTAKI